MQYTNIVLSSYQPANIPDFLDHYIFYDPVFGININYPLSAYGGMMVNYSEPQIPTVLYLNSYLYSSYYGSRVRVKNIVSNTGDFRLNHVNYNGYFNFLSPVGSTRKSSMTAISAADDQSFNFLNFSDNFTIIVTFSGVNNKFSRILSKGHWALSPGYLIQTDAQQRLYVGIGSRQGQSNGSNCFYHNTLSPCLCTDRFNHVAFVKSGNIARCYVNSFKKYLRPSITYSNQSHLLAVSGTDIDLSAGSLTLLASTFNPLMIGSDINVTAPFNSSSENFNGNIGSVKIFNTALNDTQIAADYLNSPFVNNTFLNETFTTGVTGGLIFPWGYPIQNIVYNIDLGVYKGPYTFTFIPSAIDNRYYTTVKIIYDFGNGEIYDVERDIVFDFKKSEIFGNIDVSELGNPKWKYVSHSFWPQNNTYTLYTPKVSVLTCNSQVYVFNYSFSSIPASIYDVNTINLLNFRGSDTDNKKNLLVLEAKNPNYVSNFNITDNTNTYLEVLSTKPIETGVVTFYFIVDEFGNYLINNYIDNDYLISYD